MKLTRTKKGNRYAVVFMDYLTKWPVVFATSDQTAPPLPLQDFFMEEL